MVRAGERESDRGKGIPMRSKSRTRLAAGDPVNQAVAQAVPHKGKAQQRFEALFGKVGQ